ncbi:PIN domain-containing protein [Halovivax gelatinilyticus]|uniref:PIN domain-containing protein n=1 Tax=Halovivax gelatinilyticus TaxID=2961597 RepID=UPI0020CA54D0|nr:PIN domain-containing protein [Halovivax gelatinilyticus]
MRFLDSSFLVDLLQPKSDHHEDAVDYLDSNEGRAYGAPTPILYEIYRHAAWAGGTDQLAETIDALDWIDPVAFTEPAAQESALIRAELLANGNAINEQDILIAGVARESGAPILTRDGDFENVPGLDVEYYADRESADPE